MPLAFDLRTQPFIPCLCKDGQVRDYNLADVLTQSHELLELACDTPLQTVAILRLLLAVLYCVLPIYKHEKKKWVELWRQDTLPASAITEYLNVQEGFDLFHPTRPFMQVAGLETGDAKPIATLAFEAASANNATLFDHRTDKLPVPCSPAQAARMLITAQAFSVAGGQKTEVKIDGKSLVRPNRTDSVSWAGVTLFLSGATLRETLLLNMNPLGNPRNDVSPIWEQLDPLANDNESVVRNVIDRYTWQSRLIKLLLNDTNLVSQVFITQGRVADNAPGDPIAFGDPMKVLKANKKEGLYAQRLNAGKGAWRDLQAYLAFGKEHSTSILNFAGGRVCNKNNPNEPLEEAAIYNINVVGLVSDQAKVDLWRHERMSLPATLLASDELWSMLNKGLEESESVAVNLNECMRNVVSCFYGGEFRKGKTLIIASERKPDPNAVAKLSAALDPCPAFWARLETRFAHFVAGLEAPNKADAALAAWRQNVEREASRALRESCRQLGDSPRAMKATAAVSFGFTADREKLARLAADAKTRKKAKGGT